jgi:DNA-binding response OmpR family regulator
VRFARNSGALFQLILYGLSDVAVIVLDVDPGVHGMALLEALDAWGPAPPVIVVSSLEEAHLHPVALGHGAKECLGKPVSIGRMKEAIAQLAQGASACGHRCDAWGHPCGGCTGTEDSPNERALPFARGIIRNERWIT